MTAKLDAISFELFRHACDKLYSDNLADVSDVSSTTKDMAKDNKGNTVQETYVIKCNNDSHYSLNLYLTKCSLLVNGKATENFCNNHLPLLHNIMQNTNIEGRKINIKEMNLILAEQLRIVLNSCQQVLQPSGSPAGDKCSKCKRTCKKRAALCEVGNHWIHYACDKLTKDEIYQLENSGTSNFNFNCKKCKNTNLKLEIPKQKAITYNKSIRSPTTPSLMNDHTCQKTIAESILDEEDEGQVSCLVCNQPIDVKFICELCGNSVHKHCMSTSNQDICLSCAASCEQISINSINYDQENTLVKQQTNSNTQSELDISIVQGNTNTINHVSNIQTEAVASNEQENINTVNSLGLASTSQGNKQQNELVTEKQKEIRLLENKLKKKRMI